MTVTIDGTTGVSLVQDGVVTADDLASGAITSAALPSDSILQIVSFTTNANATINSTSYTSTGVSASITPSSTSSKILVIATPSIREYHNTSNIRHFFFQLLRDSTQLYFFGGYSSGGTASNGFFYSHLDTNTMYLDSPATTSSVTYSITGKVSDAANSTEIRCNSDGASSTITLMEIAG